MSDLKKILALLRLVEQKRYNTPQHNTGSVTDWDWVFTSEMTEDDKMVKLDAPIYTVYKQTFNC